MTEEEINHIVRIAGKDVNGNYIIPRALIKVKGVSHSLADSITKIFCEEQNVEVNTKLGLLEDEKIKKLEDIILNPTEHGIPTWMLNRRKDMEEGKDVHVTGPDLDMKLREDVGREKKLRSYRGVRHSAGLTVRGQRTRTSGRKGATVGVHRKKNTKGSGK